MANPALLFFALKIITLAEAEKQAQLNQPSILQAKATTDLARAQQYGALAPLLPAPSATGSYQYKTLNAAPGTYAIGGNANAIMVSNNAHFNNFWSFSASVNQLIWDFNYTADQYRAAKRQTQSELDSEHYAVLQALQAVRNAYFTARANKELVDVSRDSVANYEKHLEQIQGFVAQGTHPEIDLAQAKSDLATAKVALITAENNYETSKAQLNQAMGVLTTTEYDVADESLPPIEGEDGAVEPLFAEAIKARPDVTALDELIASDRLLLSAQKGAWFPSLSTQVNATASGTDITNMAYNGAFSLTLSWFTGGNPGVFRNIALVKQADANLAIVGAELLGLKLQVRFDVEQARLALRAAKASVVGGNEALVNAKERLRLAEGRYSAGVGTIIELGDAQVAEVTAAGQSIQYEFNVQIARAQLIRALGRL